MRISKTFGIVLAGVVALVCLAGTAQAQPCFQPGNDPEDAIYEDFCNELDELKDQTLDKLDTLNDELDDAFFDFVTCAAVTLRPRGTIKCVVHANVDAAKVGAKKGRVCKEYGRDVKDSLQDAQKEARAERVLQEFDDDPRVSEKLEDAVMFLGICVSAFE